MFVCMKVWRGQSYNDMAGEVMSSEKTNSTKRCQAMGGALLLQFGPIILCARVSVQCTVLGLTPV